MDGQQLWEKPWTVLNSRRERKRPQDTSQQIKGERVVPELKQPKDVLSSSSKRAQLEVFIIIKNQKQELIFLSILPTQVMDDSLKQAARRYYLCWR